MIVKLLGEMAKQTIFTHAQKLSGLALLRTYSKTASRQAEGLLGLFSLVFWQCPDITTAVGRGLACLPSTLYLESIVAQALVPLAVRLRWYRS